MNLLWPGALLLLILLPALIAVYIWILRRRKRFAVRYSSLMLVREALPRNSRWRRHLPFALFLTAIASLMFALGRPVATVLVPSSQATVVLAIDVSRSMLASDISPTRLAAAQAAALSFVESQASNTRIGIVAFAGFAEMVQQPTTDQEALESAIASLTAGRGTAMGSGILEGLDVIAETDLRVAPSSSGEASGAPTALPAGTYVPSIIVVLTDGVTTTGPLPVDAAQQAVERGVRIYTIGFGTENGGIQFGGPPPGMDSSGGGGGGGGRFRRGIDEATLQQIAKMSGGEYFAAESASELLQVFENLPTTFASTTETIEISVGFVAFGALMAALAIGLSLLWNPLL